MIYVSIVLKAIGFIALRGLFFGGIVGGIYGTLLAPIIGTIYGALFGAIVGLPLGALGGLVIGIVTAVLFHPVPDVSAYRWITRILGGAIAFAGAFVGFALLTSPSSLTIHELLTDGIPFIVVPALFAAGCAIYASNSYAGFYLKEKRGKRQVAKRGFRMPMRCDEALEEAVYVELVQA